MAKVTVRGYAKPDDPIYSIGLKPLRVMKPKGSSPKSRRNRARPAKAVGAKAAKVIAGR
jgi:hypothetical protein